MVSSTGRVSVPEQRAGGEEVGSISISTGPAAGGPHTGSVVAEATAETQEVDSHVGEVTASTACSPPRPSGSSVSEAVQVSTGENLGAPRPTDAEIIEQENRIRAELDSRPLVGDVQPLSDLEQEYAAGSDIFVRKIQGLGRTYSCMRRVRGDGNCFIRAFLFALLEDITKRNDLQERNRLVTCLRQWGPKLTAAGFTELVWEDAHAALIDQLNSLGQADALTPAALLANMRDAGVSNMLVMLLRMLMSAELQRREEFFAPFILGTLDEEVGVKQFCSRYVEVMGAESDHVHIVALSDALQTPVRVLYLDRSVGAMLAGVGHAAGGESAANHHDFVPEGVAAGPPRVTVLYRPGHYDIIYPADTRGVTLSC